MCLVMDSTYANATIISHRLRTARLVQGLTQGEVATRAKIDQQQVCRMELGETSSLRLNDFLAIASALNISVPAFIAADEVPYLTALCPIDVVAVDADLVRSEERRVGKECR